MARRYKVAKVIEEQTQGGKGGPSGLDNLEKLPEMGFKKGCLKPPLLFVYRGPLRDRGAGCVYQPNVVRLVEVAGGRGLRRSISELQERP